MKNIFYLCRAFEKFALLNPFLSEEKKEQEEPTGEITEKEIEEISKYKKELGNEFWKRFLEIAEDISPVKDKENTMKIAKLMASVIQSESNFNPRAVAKSKSTGKPIAKGLSQMIRPTALNTGMTGEQWDKLDSPEGLTAIEQLPFIHKYFKKAGIKPDMKKEDVYAKNFGGYYNQPKGPKGEEIAYAGKEYTSRSGQKHPDVEFQDKAYKENIALDIVIGPDGKALIDENGNPVRKGFISKKDLSEEAAKARKQMMSEIKKIK